MKTYLIVFLFFFKGEQSLFFSKTKKIPIPIDHHNKNNGSFSFPSPEETHRIFLRIHHLLF